ncbi:MAG TPA: ABC transporter ATP-binding protein [Vicinamibacterales bacterium]|nr:ABC transporter ATP-binding protein [Vicinamibacterales bacterium]
MNPYRLSGGEARPGNPSIVVAIRRLAPVMADQRRSIIAAFLATIVASATALLGPYLIGRTVDVYIRSGNYSGLMRNAGLLLLAYLAGLVATYVQTQQMGLVGRRVLFNLRNAIFTKLQELPLDFFNQNKAGDLISRINNDTDKLNVFLAQALVQLAANLFLMAGAAILLVSLNVRLGLAALAPAAAVFVITRATGRLVKARNAASLQALGGLSGEIQESMSNFRVIVAFNRVDYFQQQFKAANDRNYAASVRAGMMNTFFIPLYGLAFNSAQLIVLGYAFYMISAGQFTVGLLIGFLLYVNSFYMPLRQLAAVWSSFQLAMASFDRISDVLALESNLPQLPGVPPASGPVMAFDHVRFGYADNQPVLRDATFSLEAGKTYALVGPTGGGKTTTASLMARLYDPNAGRVLLHGRDIRTVTPQERARRIGFILQEPFLFTGTIRDNIVYGNDALQSRSDDELSALLSARNFDGLLARFEQGLATRVTAGGDGVSLGQKQLIAFMRAVLREPDILILDEATANIDTVTEQMLEQILRELPASTTRVVIAHRLNTIENADEIYFINGGELTRAGSMNEALDLLLHHHRAS